MCGSDSPWEGPPYTKEHPIGATYQSHSTVSVIYVGAYIAPGHVMQIDLPSVGGHERGMGDFAAVQSARRAQNFNRPKFREDAFITFVL